MYNTVECGFHKSGDICDIVNIRIMNSITEISTWNKYCEHRDNIEKYRIFDSNKDDDQWQVKQSKPIYI